MRVRQADSYGLWSYKTLEWPVCKLTRNWLRTTGTEEIEVDARKGELVWIRT